MKYGILLNNTFNIGDDLQSVASAQFMPSVDYYPFKEQLSSFQSRDHEKVKVIMNSWYMWRPDHMPASEDIEPLLISMCFADQCREKLLTAPTKAWLKKYGPVGCRDMDTMQWLRDNDIDAYFSGCLTLTLTANEKLKKDPAWGGYILCVDVSDEVVNAVRQRTRRPVYSMSKWIFSNFNAVDKIDIARMYLYMYHQAAAVVTGNMHTSLPSLALNTPVCLLVSENNRAVNRGNSFHAERRFEGLIDFFNHYTTDELLNDPKLYDFDDPPANPQTHLKYREDLIRRCEQFTGYSDRGPAIKDDFCPSMELMKLLQYCRWTPRSDYKGMICVPSRKKILKAALLRYTGKDKNDLIQY